MKDIQEKLKKAWDSFSGGRYWQHYKGGVYEFLDFAVDTDNGELRVRYRPVEGRDFSIYGEREVHFVRPLREWFEDVEKEPGIFVPRFKKTRKVEIWKEYE
jgi:hypothetical protein